MQYIYTALFKPIEDGSGYYAKVPDLPGCITTGKNLPDAINQITDAMSAWILRLADKRGINCSQVLQDSLRAILENPTTAKIH